MVSISSDDRRAWLAAADAAGLSVELERDELVERAQEAGVDVHWIVKTGHDLAGNEVERYAAFLMPEYQAGERGTMLGADTVEEAIRLIAGEALSSRLHNDPT